jgi:hypothetical protein
MRKSIAISTIDYDDLPPRLGGNAGALPLLHWEDSDRLEIYVPDWAPEMKVLELEKRVNKTLHPQKMRVYRVRDVPRQEVFGDWYDAAPEGTP